MKSDDATSQAQPSRGFLAKRWFDVIVTLSVMPVALPAFLLVALAVRCGIGSPILFKQQRPGLYGSPFTLFKFRTMTDARDRDGQLLPDSQRLTRVGRFLRSTSLDEIPELLNVLKGEMSLVGPRPLLMEYLAHYTPEQQRRHLVPPGLTGWAQVNGRNTANWQQRFLLDLWYVEHRSMWLDCKILLLTPWKVLKREGMMHPDDPSWEGNFKGASSDRPSR